MDSQALCETLNVREQERERLARLLESRLGQSLNVLLAQIHAHQGERGSSPLALRTIAGMVARILTDLRELTADLAPGDLQDLGLVPALESLALRIEYRYGLTVTLDTTALSAPLPLHLPLPVYRIVQLALDNAGQHAGAGRVGVSLQQNNNGLRFIIADDGNGFHPPEPLDALVSEGKRGFAEMVEWAAAAGGTVDLSSVMGVGTQVRVVMPLSVPEPDQKASYDGGDAQAAWMVESLTPRECDVLAGIIDGLTNKQIAVRLGISDRTVQFHLGNLLSKLGVSSRTEAAVLALQKGLVSK